MKNKHLFISGSCTLLLASFSFVHAQGPLNPPGTPAPTMKTLQQVEPRTPISSLPFTISTSGSYYLTTNLTGGAGDNGITISADNVTLDLLGFALIGVPGSLDGVRVPATRVNLTIHNGTVRNWGGDGMDAANAENSHFDRLRIYNNTGAGLKSGFGGSISHCKADANGGNGINADDSSGVSDCTATSNGGHGFSLGDGCTARSCVANLNATNGITALIGNTISDCSGQDNAGDGITTGRGGVIRDCTARANNGVGIDAFVGSKLSGCVADSNSGIGITAGEGNTVKDCVAENNGGNGISLGSGSTASGCIARGNDHDGISAGGGCGLNNCSGYSNGGYGIAFHGGSSAVNCVANFNGLSGILAGGVLGEGGNTVSKCSASDNTFDGITAAISTTIEGCASYRNGGVGIRADRDSSAVNSCTVVWNTADGILVRGDSRVIGNTCDSNGMGAGDGAGIHATGADNRIEGNTVTDNDRGIDVDTFGNLIIKNSASGNVTNGNSTNYDIVANNKVGEIVLAPNSAAINGSTGGAGVGSTDPWANISF